MTQASRIVAAKKLLQDAGYKVIRPEELTTLHVSAAIPQGSTCSPEVLQALNNALVEQIEDRATTYETQGEWPHHNCTIVHRFLTLHTVKGTT